MVRLINHRAELHLTRCQMMMREVFYYITLFSFLTVPALAVGCQRKSEWNLGLVQGTLTFAGEPLADVQVVFLTDGQADARSLRSSGITDGSGRYELRTDAGERGVEVGGHRVVLVDLRIAAKARLTGPRKDLAQFRKKARAHASERFPKEYCDFTKTPLHAAVRPGSQTLNFEIP